MAAYHPSVDKQWERDKLEEKRKDCLINSCGVFFFFIYQEYCFFHLLLLPPFPTSPWHAHKRIHPPPLYPSSLFSSLLHSPLLSFLPCSLPCFIHGSHCVNEGVWKGLTAAVLYMATTRLVPGTTACLHACIQAEQHEGYTVMSFLAQHVPFRKRIQGEGICTSDHQCLFSGRWCKGRCKLVIRGSELARKISGHKPAQENLPACLFHLFSLPLSSLFLHLSGQLPSFFYSEKESSGVLSPWNDLLDEQLITKGCQRRYGHVWVCDDGQRRLPLPCGLSRRGVEGLCRSARVWRALMCICEGTCLCQCACAGAGGVDGGVG